MTNPLRMDAPPRRNRNGDAVTRPLYSLGTAALFVVAAVVVLVSGEGNRGNGALLVIALVTTLPSLVAAGFAERVSRDVRNGVIVEKVREGSRKALDDTGVTQAVTDGQSTTPAALLALTRLLEQNTTATKANTQAHNTDNEGK